MNVIPITAPVEDEGDGLGLLTEHEVIAVAKAVIRGHGGWVPERAIFQACQWANEVRVGEASLALVLDGRLVIVGFNADGEPLIGGAG